MATSNTLGSVGSLSAQPSSSSQSSSLTPAIQEYSIRVPKNTQKNYHVMRFNGTLDVDFTQWNQVKMERENNMREFKMVEEDQPKFGAGSEFGREAREEARRKKLGIIQKKYKPNDQPWILKTCGSTVKKFKGIREGGVGENAAYYVFTHAADGAIEAFPLLEWYKFQPIQRYKALSSEEAEQEFSKRNKHLNYFSLMLRKRLKGDTEAELDEGEDNKKSAGKKSKELKISEMDEWMESTEGESSEEEPEKPEDEEEKEDKKNKKIKKAAVDKKKKKKKKNDSDAEAFEDSDDGDDEGRELDYISDSSDSEPETAAIASVAEEKALRNILNSDEEDSDDDENKSDKEQSHNEEEKEKNEETSPEKTKDQKKKKSKNSKDKKEVKKEKHDPNSDFSSDSDTDEDVKKKKGEKKGDKKLKKDDLDKICNSAGSSRSVTPTDNKRKLVSDALAGPSNKRAKLDPMPNYLSASEIGITEEAVRKYLMRKPITPTELISKFKIKKSDEVKREQLINTMTGILKKVNPIKQTVKGKMYLFLKS